MMIDNFLKELRPYNSKVVTCAHSAAEVVAIERKLNRKLPHSSTYYLINYFL